MKADVALHATQAKDKLRQAKKGAPQGKVSFIASYPKSGNTYVRILLQAFVDGRVDINDLDAVCGDAGTHLAQPIAPTPVQSWSPENICVLRPAIVGHMAYLSSFTKTAIWKSHWVNDFIMESPSFPSHFTHKILYLVRDPRDVVVSLARHYGMEIQQAMEVMMTKHFVIEGQGSYMSQVTSSWQHHVDSFSKGSRVPSLIVRYEDLIAKPVEEFAAIVDHFELKGRVTIEEAVEMADIAKIKGQEEDQGFTERKKQDRFFTDPAPRKWEGILTDNQQRALMNQVRALDPKFQEFLGYDETG